MSNFWDFYFKNVVYPTKENDILLVSLKNIKKNKMQTIKNLVTVGDTVYLLDHPDNNDPNHLAVVRKIYKNNNILVSNTNMPFMGTYSLSNGLIKKGKYKKYNDKNKST